MKTILAAALVLSVASSFGAETKEEKAETKGEKRIRAIYIERAEAGLKVYEKAIANIKKAKVVKGKNGYPLDDDFTAASAKDKANFLKSWTAQFTMEQKRIAELKAGSKINWPSIGEKELQFGDIGFIGTVFVSSVVDKNRAVVTLGSNQGKAVLAYFPTEKFAPGSRVELRGIWEITGNAKGEMFEVKRADE